MGIDLSHMLNILCGLLWRLDHIAAVLKFPYGYDIFMLILAAFLSVSYLQ